ncbi:MAG TPA: RNA 2',3'-cyclic phosphodiesterase [Gammaproteobacteria bacterium]|nr:RNA 2',3'-cyclic phosphodiesterase [Gammaproteobacteria bacterium]
MPDTPDPSAPRQRLFFALWPDDAVRARFDAVAGKALKRRGRRIPAQNLHLTLAFLGSVGPETRRCAESAADGITGAPFTLEFTHLGYWSRARVIWSGCDETPEGLTALVNALRRGLVGCGIEPEVRPYRAHLTLARKASVDPGFGAPHAPIQWPVDAIHLLESKTLSSGAQYQILRSWPLRGRLE